MSTLKISGDNLLLNGNLIKRESLFSKDFMNYSDIRADDFFIDHFCVNEMFVYQVQKYLALEYFISSHREIKKIVFDSASLDLLFYAHHIAKEKNIEVKSYIYLKCAQVIFYSLFVNFISMLFLCYQMVKIPYSKENISLYDEFTVLRQRSKQSIQKIKKFPNIHQEIEDVYSKTSIYRFYPRFTRIMWVIRGYLNSLKDYDKIKNFYTPLVGKGTVCLMYQWYSKRAVHTELFSELLNNYLKLFIGKTYYTGSNLDRYSVVEEKATQKYNIRTICIPHGLEYGYKFPKGFSCDFCYTTGKEAADHLNKLYQTKKFKWDEGIAINMFKLDAKVTHPRMVVFFTEPREVYIHYKIIEELAPRLSAIGIKLFLKLHPADNPSDYEPLKLDVITDYNMALIGNICIARKSTTLLEAIYNNSLPIAIITNSLDQVFFDTFPSLNTDKILKKYSVDELFNAISHEIKGENKNNIRV